MKRRIRVWLMVLLAAPLASCTAWRVVTHRTSSDPVQAPAGRYRLDPPHWSVVFDVDHFGFSRFVMRFRQVSATVDLVPQNPEQSRVSAVIQAASVDTNDAALDRLVQGPDMLDVEHFPQIRFASTALRRTAQATGEMTGNLTIHGRTRPVLLQVTYNGGAPNPLTRDYTLGFGATGAFDRSEFGLNAWFPAVGDQIRLSIQAEFAANGGGQVEGE